MPDLLVLCYHAVSAEWESDLSVTPDLLDRQLAGVVGRGYRGATFTAALSAPPQHPTVVVTFDDAYRSVGEVAAPVLARHGLPGTVFAPTRFIGTERPMSWPGIDHHVGGPHEHELVPHSWEELRGLAQNGWEVGSHTVGHPHLTRLGDEELADELTASRQAVAEAMGHSCTSIAYPYGDVDGRVVAAARAAGYTAGAALPAVWHAPRPLETPRVGVYAADDGARLRVKTSRAVRALRARLGR